MNLMSKKTIASWTNDILTGLNDYSNVLDLVCIDSVAETLKEKQEIAQSDLMLEIHSQLEQVCVYDEEACEWIRPASLPKLAIIDSIDNTTFEDGTSWVCYLVGGHDGEYGYEITEKEYQGNDPEALKEWTMEHLTSKPSIGVCSPYLERLVKRTLGSENEMWFVEYEDVDPTKQDELEESIKKEMEELGLDGYITFHEDESFITVYGGIITKFLF